MKQLPPEFYPLMEELQAIDFVLVELTLYLDTHPHDYEAIKQFNYYSKQRRLVKKQVESIYGPLEQFGHSYSKYPWDWNNSSWPWQV